jgi:transcriptional regulator with XRE-family HTH domain
MNEKTVHIGRKICRLREIKGLKQDVLAQALGVSQQTISNIENNPKVDEEVLGKIATVLGLTPEAIKLFNEEAIFNNIQHNTNTATGNTIVNYQFQFNPLDKIVELYERLLQSEREKNDLLKSKRN